MDLRYIQFNSTAESFQMKVMPFKTVSTCYYPKSHTKTNPVART